MLNLGYFLRFFFVNWAPDYIFTAELDDNLRILNTGQHLATTTTPIAKTITSDNTIHAWCSIIPDSKFPGPKPQCSCDTKKQFVKLSKI